MSTKPVFVLLHGAWHTPACYAPLTSLLSIHGYTSICPALPSVGLTPSPAEALKADIAVVRVAVQELLNDGRDVVVVMHSYSGIPGGSALEGLDKDSRAGRGLRGGVIRLVYVMAWMVGEGYVHSRRRKDDSAGPVVVDEKVWLLMLCPYSSSWAGVMSFARQNLAAMDC